jgi:hypothetical protein
MQDGLWKIVFTEQYVAHWCLVSHVMLISVLYLAAVAEYGRM